MKRSRAGSGSRWRSQRVRLLSGFNWVETSLVETTSRRAIKAIRFHILDSSYSSTLFLRWWFHYIAPHLFSYAGSIFSHWGTKAELLWGSELIAKRSRGDVSFCDAGIILWITICFQIWLHRGNRPPGMLSIWMACEARRSKTTHGDGWFVIAKSA